MEHKYSIGALIEFSSTNMRNHTITGIGTIISIDPDRDSPSYLVKLHNAISEIDKSTGDHVIVQEWVITREIPVTRLVELGRRLDPEL